MKKKLISALLTGTLILSLSMGASAASVTAGVTQEEGTITVSGAVSNAAAGQQVTILVVKDGTDLDELTSSDVAYIDQVSATGNYSVSFQMPTAMSYGTYDVYVGGSEVTTLATTEFTLEGTHTLSGSGISTSASGADLTKIWIRVYNAGTETLVEECNVTADGSFSLYVPSGTYDIKVGRSGYLAKTYSNITINSDEANAITNLQLIAGDTDQSGVIDVGDWSNLMLVLGGSESTTDFNDDSVTDVIDWGTLLANLGNSY